MSGRRLDGDPTRVAPSLWFTGDTVSDRVTGVLTFGDFGCWLVTASRGGATLSFVVVVQTPR